MDLNETPQQVYLMGDSLTGQEGRYGRHLQEVLGRRYVINWRGIPGNTTAQMRARFDADVIAPGNASHVVIWGGVNDIAQGSTSAEITANLAAMYEAARAANITVIAVTIGPFSRDADWDSSSPRARGTQDDVNAWIKTAAAISVEINHTLEDPKTPYTLRPEFDDGSHIHLTDAGYAAVATAISTAFQ